jgi:hypothetical protein
VVVRIRSISVLQGSVTPSALNSEVDIVNLPSQSYHFILEGFVSLQNMASDDAVTIRCYVAVDGTNQVKSDEATFTGAQAVPAVRIPAVTLAYNSKPRITVTQTAGSTLKSFPYTIIIEYLEEL